MTNPSYPGVYIEEIPGVDASILPAKTSVTAFVGVTADGPVNTPSKIDCVADFHATFGAGDHQMALAVGDYFANGGGEARVVRVSGAVAGNASPDQEAYNTAFDTLRDDRSSNLLCLPPSDPDGEVEFAVLERASNLCVETRAVLIVDPRRDWTAPSKVLDPATGVRSLPINGMAATHAAVYFPRLVGAGPTRVPCGAVAGVIARTDGTHGVWKSPAGIEARIENGARPTIVIEPQELEQLNPLGVNCLRELPPHGCCIWGGRTVAGGAVGNDAWTYISVRRLALFIEASIKHGTKWVVFEPNAEPTWAKIRQKVNAFMQRLFVSGAFPGATTKGAFYVRCDDTTMTQQDIDAGIVNAEVGFAPIRPAEFIILTVRQHSAAR